MLWGMSGMKAISYIELSEFQAEPKSPNTAPYIIAVVITALEVVDVVDSSISAYYTSSSVYSGARVSTGFSVPVNEFPDILFPSDPTKS